MRNALIGHMKGDLKTFLFNAKSKLIISGSKGPFKLVIGPKMAEEYGLKNGQTIDDVHIIVETELGSALYGKAINV